MKSVSVGSVFCEKLRYLRRLNGYTQQEIANMMGVVRSAYTYYELGKTMPFTHSLPTLARLYNVSIDYFLLDSIAVSDFSSYPLERRRL